MALQDTLKTNTTYTIDFSDAIADNNEGNPLGNYTYSFSTGNHIDTMEVAGYVLEAQNLEPIKGILVGLYRNLNDTAFQHEPMMRNCSYRWKRTLCDKRCGKRRLSYLCFTRHGRQLQV